MLSLLNISILILLTVGTVHSQGGLLDSISSNDETAMDCGENEEYDSCGSSCPRTCDDLYYPQEPKVCNEESVVGCFCKDGYYRKNGICVKGEECCDESKGEIFTRSGVCPETCVHEDNPKPCTLQLVDGCFCKPDLVRIYKDPKSRCINRRFC